MNDRSNVLLLSSAVIAGVAALFCAARRLCWSTAALGEIRDSVKENLAETRTVHKLLRRQRGAINQMHQYLMPVPKGVKKRHRKPNRINGRISEIRLFQNP